MNPTPYHVPGGVGEDNVIVTVPLPPSTHSSREVTEVADPERVGLAPGGNAPHAAVDVASVLNVAWRQTITGGGDDANDHRENVFTHKTDTSTATPATVSILRYNIKTTRKGDSQNIHAELNFSSL